MREISRPIYKEAIMKHKLTPLYRYRYYLLISIILLLVIYLIYSNSINRETSDVKMDVINSLCIENRVYYSTGNKSFSLLLDDDNKTIYCEE